MGRTIRIAITVITLLGFSLIAFLVWTRFFGSYLWMQELEQVAVFWTWLKARLYFFVFGSILGSTVVFLNLWFARKVCHRNPRGGPNVRMINQRVVVLTERPVPLLAVVLGALFAGLVCGLLAQPLYESWLFYFSQVPFEVVDPLFGYDASLYVYDIPFYRALLLLFNASLVLSLLGSLALHCYHGTPGFITPGRPPEGVYVHLCCLLASFLLGLAPAFLLYRLDLIIYGSGVASGAGYVDATIRSPVYIGLALYCLVASVVLALSRKPSQNVTKLVAMVLAIPLFTGIGLKALPLAVQTYRVAPNELELERSFIASGISMTLKGYALEEISMREIDSVREVSAIDLNEHLDTVQNIRLWDWEPLLETYRQLQALRQYYNFLDADIDRYTIDGDYRQTMLAAREISWEKMDAKAKTWVNVHLKYTHGYGAVLSPVNEVSREGQPSLWMRDIPPVTSPGLEVTEPAIYFGNGMPWFVLANSKEEELHYPDGDSNVYNRYDGKGGIPLTHWGRRLALSVYLGDLNILLSGSVTPETRLLFNRDILSRLSTLAPSLSVDDDPYLVLSEGKYYWIADMYTSTKRFPYSQQEAGLNYIRNSVKAVVDAYDGTVRLYVVDPNDPLLKTYQNIYPTLFTAVDECPETLRNHFRYPERLFTLQSEIFKLYHMKEPRVFYNKEDVWNAPTESKDGQDISMEPYYMVMRLPGEEKLEFLLMLPFVPRNKDNLIAWMAARCDAPNYGELVVYQFPKDRLLYGPRQIATRIEQNTLISQQIALWDQSGSQVIRGSLLVIPIEGTLIYVQPLYLKGRSANLPELKRVIVAAGERVIMAETLEEALASAVGQTLQGASQSGLPEARNRTVTPVGDQPRSVSGDPELQKENEQIRKLAETAAKHYQAADAAVKEGDWAGYGEQMKQLEQTLEQLKKL